MSQDFAEAQDHIYHQVELLNGLLNQLGTESKTLIKLFQDRIQTRLISDPSATVPSGSSLSLQWAALRSLLDALEGTCGHFDPKEVCVDELSDILADVSAGKINIPRHKIAFPYFILKMLLYIRRFTVKYVDGLRRELQLQNTQDDTMELAMKTPLPASKSPSRDALSGLNSKRSSAEERTRALNRSGNNSREDISRSKTALNQVDNPDTTKGSLRGFKAIQQSNSQPGSLGRSNQIQTEFERLQSNSQPGTLSRSNQIQNEFERLQSSTQPGSLGRSDLDRSQQALDSSLGYSSASGSLRRQKSQKSTEELVPAARNKSSEDLRRVVVGDQVVQPEPLTVFRAELATRQDDYYNTNLPSAKEKINAEIPLLSKQELARMTVPELEAYAARLTDPTARSEVLRLIDERKGSLRDLSIRSDTFDDPDMSRKGNSSLRKNGSGPVRRLLDKKISSDADVMSIKSDREDKALPLLPNDEMQRTDSNSAFSESPASGYTFGPVESASITTEKALAALAGKVNGPMTIRTKAAIKVLGALHDDEDDKQGADGTNRSATDLFKGPVLVKTEPKSIAMQISAQSSPDNTARKMEMSEKALMSSSEFPQVKPAEHVQLIMIPLNGMFEPCYLTLSIPNKFGRNNANNYAKFMAFPSQVVSRTHAEIWAEKDMVFIKDNGSNSGTFLNGRRLSEAAAESIPFEIKSGDMIQLGKDFVEDKNAKEGVAALPEPRHRSVKMRVHIVPRDENVKSSGLTRSRSGNLDSGSRDNLTQTAIPLPLKIDTTPQQQQSSPSAPRKELGKKEIFVVGVSVSSGPKVGLGGQKVKEIQVASAKGGADVIFNVNLKNWENKSKLTIFDLRPAYHKTANVEITPDPINNSLFNVMSDNSVFIGSLQVVNNLKLQLNLPISGSLAPNITITGDFKECKYIVVEKSATSREQRFIGQSSGKHLFKASNKESKWIFNLEFEDGEWSRLLLYAVVFLTIQAHHEK